jgi:hypothetical protein
MGTIQQDYIKIISIYALNTQFHKRKILDIKPDDITIIVGYLNTRLLPKIGHPEKKIIKGTSE